MWNDMGHDKWKWWILSQMYRISKQFFLGTLDKPNHFDKKISNSGAHFFRVLSGYD